MKMIYKCVLSLFDVLLPAGIGRSEFPGNLRKRFVWLFVLMISGLTQAAPVVVIPLGSDAQNLKNVITVALAGGDFSNPVAAINSIPNTGAAAPSAANRYLIVIGPGEYNINTQQLIMREWVSIQGSGREATVIKGSVSGDNFGQVSALVVGADNAALTDLSVENTASGGENAFAIFSYLSAPRLERLNAYARGASVSNVGLWITSASPVMTDIITTGEGGISAIGLQIHQTDSALTNITATGKGSTAGNQGVYITFSSAVMNNIRAVAMGLGNSPVNEAVYISQADPTISNLRTVAGNRKQGGYGVRVVFSSSPFIRNSVLSGATDGLWLSDDSVSRTKVVNSEIINGVTDGASGTQCRETYDKLLADVGC